MNAPPKIWVAATDNARKTGAVLMFRFWRKAVLDSCRLVVVRVGFHAEIVFVVVFQIICNRLFTILSIRLELSTSLRRIS